MNLLRRIFACRFVIVIACVLLLQKTWCLPQRSSSVQGRYVRPGSQDRDSPKCSRSCSDSADRDRDDDEYKSETRRDYEEKGDSFSNPSAPGYDRDNKPTDQKPKPPVRGGYNSKPVDRDVYDAKPDTDDGYKPIPPAPIDYNPKPVTRDEYDTKPIDEYKPKPPVRDDYNTKPVVRDEYDSKPVDDYKPKPPVRVDYNIKPIIRDEYDTKPIDEFKPKPPVRDDYDTKPIDEYKPKPPVRDDYDTKPVVRDEYKPQPAVIDEYKPKPPVRVDYNSKPIPRDDYVPQPAIIDDYKPKPIRRDDYVPQPAIIEDYKPKPIPRDDYVPQPAVIDEYKPKPPVRVDYNSRPVNRDDYDSKPISEDRYKPKPPNRDDYDSKPVSEDRYKPKPPSRDDYDSKPVSEDRYKPKPPNRDGYNSNPTEDHAPKPPTRDSYRPLSGGGYYSGYPVKKDDDYKVPGGGFDDSKDNDYNDYDKSDENTNVRPVPMSKDENCICVPYYQCTDGHIVTDGAGIIDARRRKQPDEELPLDGKFKPPSCGPFHVCCNTPESSTVKPYEHRCGVRNPSGINSRILSPSNKGEADFGEWPWQAAVLKSEGTVNIFQCGGVLIDKFHVLTVAHCVFHLYKYQHYPLKVRLGEWDTQKTSEFLAHEDYKVSKITIHPEYRNTSLWNDIAILRLQDPVLFAPHIDTVCLPKYDEIFSGQNCVVTGWGKESYKGGTFSNVMKEVALQVIDNYGCEEMLRKTRLGRFFQLHEGFVCAGGEHGLDSCKGDGGGPLVCYRKDRSYALAGLVSWGIDCGQPGVPGVYVKVQKYLDWISKNTGVDVQDYWPKH